MLNKIITIAVVGHINAGKSTLIESLTDHKITKLEKDGITENINVYEKIKDHYKIFYVDTIGHTLGAGFRKYIMENADCVFLIVDINKGIQSETERCLRELKMPFYLILTKTDLCSDTQNRTLQIMIDLENYDVDILQTIYGKDLHIEIDSIFEKIKIRNDNLILNVLKGKKAPQSIQAIVKNKDQKKFKYNDFEYEITDWYSQSNCFVKSTEDGILYGKICDKKIFNELYAGKINIPVFIKAKNEKSTFHVERNVEKI